jgi:uncharacterized protein (DUF2252 family)
MSASPFAFYRGAGYVMASDLAGTPKAGIRVQLCGDAHLANFGGFASPERQLLFDVVDFDEALPCTRTASTHMAAANSSNHLWRSRARSPDRWNDWHRSTHRV